MLSSIHISVVARPTRAARTRLAFYGALCLVTYWSMLLALRAVVFESLLTRPESRALVELLPGYGTVAVGVVAEVAFFFLTTAVVVMTLRLQGERARTGRVMTGMALAHVPLLAWAALALVTTSFLTSADAHALLGQGEPTGIKRVQLVAQALSLLSAPELLVRVAQVRRRPAMVACALVGAAVTAVVFFASRT
jgi:hypothetical protein